MKTQDFIRKAKELFSNQFDYSKVNYKGSRKKVTIYCNRHETFFEQTPESHLQGKAGCKSCMVEKMQATNRERYGHNAPLQNESVKSKMIQTNLEKYGVENVRHVEAFETKRQETIKEKYGVEEVLSAPEVRKKITDTNLERYGGPSPMASKEVQEKVVSTLFERYGVENPSYIDGMGDKIRSIMLTRHGVEYIMQDPEVVAQSIDTKRKNNSFASTRTEDLFYEMLLGCFDKEDIERQYSSPDYPFLSDFYIKSRNMYIELNINWTHNYKWFDEDNIGHLEELKDFEDKSLTHPYYASTVETWTQRDVEKRRKAKEANLNYVVLWDYRLRDGLVWISLGCPDGKDWGKMYSWIPEKRLVNDYIFPQNMNSSTAITGFAKYFHFDIFYKKEIEMWYENKPVRQLPLQVWLYANRCKYLKKSVMEFRSYELLKGFKVGGIYRGYSSFPANLMRDIIRDYRIESIYDPCAGWGERMIASYRDGIRYLGVDVREELESGYREIIKHFGMSDQKFIIEDSSEFVPYEPFDMVFTCPPYHDTEIYSEIGAENLSYDLFLKWWDKVIKNSLRCKPSYFAFQIDTKHRDDMKMVCESNSLKFLEERFYQKNPSMHFNKAKGNHRKNIESILIFEV